MSSPPSSPFLHPASGALILGLDWLLFSGSVVSLGLSTPSLAVIGFLMGLVGTTWIQGRYGTDRRLVRLSKGLLAGILVGIPFPVAGTVAGGAVLAASGLDRLSTSSGPDEED